MKNKSSKIRIAFLGSPPFNLSLLDFFHKHPRCEVACLWTKDNPVQSRNKKVNPLIIYAKDHHIPIITSNHIQIEHHDILKKYCVDVGFISAFGTILKKKFYEIPPLGIYNLHFSLLPKYRGSSPIQSAIFNGDEVGGVSIQKISEKLDAGDIYLQKEFSIKNRFNHEVFQISIEETKVLLEKWIEDVLQGSLSLSPQDHSQKTLCHKIKKSDGQIDIYFTEKKIFSHFYAFYGWPKTYFLSENIQFTLLGIKSCSLEKQEVKGLISMENKLYLSLYEGVIEITDIQRQGKKSQNAKDFIHGYGSQLPLKIEDVLK